MTKLNVCEPEKQIETFQNDFNGGYLEQLRGFI